MIEAEIQTEKPIKVIVVLSHGAYGLDGQMPVPSEKSFDRAFAAVSLYQETLRENDFSDVEVVFIGGWRGDKRPSTARLMSDAFHQLIGVDINAYPDDKPLIPVSVLGQSKETRRNLEELSEFLNDRFDPKNTEIQIVSQQYHNSQDRIDRLANHLLGDYANKTNFLSVEELESRYPKRFEFAPEIKRTASMAELVHILFIETGHILDKLTDKEFTFERIFYDGIDRFRRGSHYINSIAARLTRTPTDKENPKQKSKSG
ncbi:hypothetical protein KC675_02200 [Candidatus Dojkabacteria bacterium]|mgnify:CR=1 FL=1|uniref:DUF218 domain-containing protein n=1 Tax=Candidatus Dojkabacteria bacterium TaxID=2099670 RepID=A0A955I8W5_9BACT|nr:hypothetical protein [Candidatus Dojkabacteria bacterium]